jgi:hypothetical protein
MEKPLLTHRTEWSVAFGWKSKFGILQPSLFVCSNIGIALVMGALMWFWSLNPRNDPNSLWSTFALNGWTPSAIAACCAILRACISIQLGVCCVMLATIAFAKNSVLLRDAAAMSIYRFATCSPWTMMFPVIRGFRNGTNFVPIFLVTLLSTVAISSQFISTIIMKDTGVGFILGYIEKRTVEYPPPGASHQRDPWGSNPIVFPRFAESTDSGVLLQETGNTTAAGPRGLRGTGRTLRAYFPLNSFNRTSLLYYSGIAGIVEANVLCMSPELIDLTYHPSYGISGRLTANYLFESLKFGRLNPQNSFEWNSRTSGSDYVFSFNCTVDTGTQFAFCYLRGLLDDGSSCDDNFPTKCLFPSGNTWILVHSNSGWASEPLYNGTTGFKFNGTEWTTKSGRYFEPGDEVKYETAFAMSVCVLGTATADANITANANSTGVEPVFGSSTSFLDITDYRGNTATIRKQFNNSGDLRQREILDLKISKQELENARPAIWGNDFVPARLEYLKESILLGDQEGIYGDIFASTIETAPLSSALQTIITLINAQSYYDYLATGKGWPGVRNKSVELQIAKPVIVPTTSRGLLIICGIVVLNFVSVAITFWLYFTCDAPKLLNQAWYAIAQLHTGDAKAFLGEVGTLGDDKVRELPEAADIWKSPVKITENGIVCKSADFDILPSMCLPLLNWRKIAHEIPWSRI